MKKVIEISDDIRSRLEAVQAKLNVKSLSPIIDMAISIGLQSLEYFASGYGYGQYFISDSSYGTYGPASPGWYSVNWMSGMTGDLTT